MMDRNLMCGLRHTHLHHAQLQTQISSQFFRSHGRCGRVVSLDDPMTYSLFLMLGSTSIRASLVFVIKTEHVRVPDLYTGESLCAVGDDSIRSNAEPELMS